MLFRFPILPRIWATLLILVNAGSLAFIDTIYGQINLLALIAAIAVMAVIYAKIGFVRLLGIGHIFWIPMLIWFALHPPSRSVQPALYGWVLSLFFFNSISLVIDAIDVVRFISGSRRPHYTWRLPDADTNS